MHEYNKIELKKINKEYIIYKNSLENSHLRTKIKYIANMFYARNKEVINYG